MTEPMSDDGHHSPHDPDDPQTDEPLGPFTPDDETPAGTTTEVHSGLSPIDLPKDHPGRKEAERLAARDEHGETHGNVASPLGERTRRALGAQDDLDESAKG